MKKLSLVRATHAVNAGTMECLRIHVPVSSSLQVCRILASVQLPSTLCTTSLQLPSSLYRKFRSASVHVCGCTSYSQSREEKELPELLAELNRERMTVGVFWDLDNKPPNTVPAYDAAVRLRNMASGFGEVVDMVAYANSYAFKYVPPRVREERQDRRMLDQLERKGVVKVMQPYICSFCGRKCKTNLDLKKHFKQLHERERQKRVNWLSTLKGKRRLKFKEKNSEKEQRYLEAARTVLVPKVGYGLASELKRAGVSVRTVDNKPQAADEAIKRHMSLYINKGIHCLILVSDDTDFMDVLRTARERRLYTVVVGDARTLRKNADTSFSWEEVASGKAKFTADEKYRNWFYEADLRREIADCVSDESNFGESWYRESDSDDENERNFSRYYVDEAFEIDQGHDGEEARNLQTRHQVSAFAEVELEDEEYYPEEEEEDKDAYFHSREEDIRSY